MHARRITQKVGFAVPVIMPLKNGYSQIAPEFMDSGTWSHIVKLEVWSPTFQAASFIRSMSRYFEDACTFRQPPVN